MKIEKKIEHWLKDEKFCDYCNTRINEEIKEILLNGAYDHFFELLDEGFDGNDEYVVPLVEYLSCKLHYAKLLKNKAKRESIIWWVFTQLNYEGFYTRVFATYFDPLVKETNITIIKMLRKEYLLLKKQSA